MAGELNRAAWYLSKAAELRALAEDYSNRETREALLFIARGYERLAENMTMIHVTPRPDPLDEQSSIERREVDSEHLEPEPPGSQSGT